MAIEGQAVISVEQYLATILSAVVRLPAVEVALSESLGAVLASDLRTPIALPPFTSSAMDGYALRAADLAGASQEAPVELCLLGEVLMGVPPACSVNSGEALAVLTGGMLPEGADTVVPLEQCREAGGIVTVCAPVTEGRHVRPAGEDAPAGALICSAGTLVGPALAGALASAGLARVPIYPKPRVGILSTGDELAEPGEVLARGRIYDSNSHLLEALAAAAGAVPVQLGRAPDDPAMLLEHLDAFAGQVDIFVCSGGVSAGRSDPVKRAFPPGSEVCCASVAIQPGHPQAFGIRRGKPLFGLPGNPVSALVSFCVFVRPALEALAGVAAGRAMIEGVLDGRLESAREGARRYSPAVLRNDRGTLKVTPLPPAGNNRSISLAAADCLVEAASGRPLEAGDRCRILPFGLRT
ncbi:MAG: molybdopterin molybdotransferase MoeA [Actinomycetota bacterium]